jgi:hypothetical protein
MGGSGKVWGADRTTLLKFAEIARVAVSHGRVVAVVDRDQKADKEVAALGAALAKRGLGFYCIARRELEDYWLLSPKLTHAILSGLCSEAIAVGADATTPPTVEEIEVLVKGREKQRALDVLNALCEKAHLRWSKEAAARIAMEKIDDLAPEVSTEIMKDVDAALTAAMSIGDAKV